MNNYNKIVKSIKLCQRKLNIPYVGKVLEYINMNFMHQFFKVTLENSAVYILELKKQNPFYNLELMESQNSFNHQEIEELIDEKNLTLEQLIEKTTVEKKYNVFFYNCQHFAQRVLNKFNSPLIIPNIGQAIREILLEPFKNLVFGAKVAIICGIVGAVIGVAVLVPPVLAIIESKSFVDGLAYGIFKIFAVTKELAQSGPLLGYIVGFFKTVTGSYDKGKKFAQKKDQFDRARRQQ